MNQWSRFFRVVLFAALLLMGHLALHEASAWARAGGGSSFGSRGSRSFAPPQRPSGPGPGFDQRSSSPFSQPRSTPSSPSGGSFMRSPFAQGLAGGLLGGFVGSLLFGGSGHAATTGGGSSGIGLMDLVLIGALLYFLMRFLKRRREQAAMASSAYRQASVPDYSAMPRTLEPARGAAGDTADARAGGDLERGFDQIRQFDANFSEERFKETAQDIFFCIQAAWMRRDLKGAENLVTEEMAAWMGEQYASLRDKGHINRLENIAVRKVELTEAWQESGMEFVTVLLTANLLDYTVDEKTGAVVAGDRDQPVKFEEFWTFTRSIGTPQWRLSAIHQAE